MDDHEILNVLREALSHDDAGAAEYPPASAVEAAVAAGRWTRLDYELAALTDSAESGEPVAGVRAAGVRADPVELRHLTYSLEDLTIVCELGPSGLAGLVVPATGLRLELVMPNGSSRQLDLDVDGRFLLDPPPAGPVGIRCTRPGRQAVLTPWLLA